MSAKGEKQVFKGGEGIQQLCGLALVEEIVAINPTNEQKAKLYGYEYDAERDEVEYTSKNEKGKSKLSLDVYFRINGEFPPRKQRFFLENESIEFEDGDKTKMRYVNQVGQTTTVEDESELGDWFTQFQKWDDEAKKFVNIDHEKTFRKCLKGEDSLMRFLREALSINYNMPSADLSYNYKKLFSGDVKELLNDLQGDLFRKFVVMLQVTNKEKTDPETEEKTIEHFEKLWLPNNNFQVPSLSEESYKHINNGCRFPTGWVGKQWKKYVKGHTEYPPTGFAPLKSVYIYDSGEDIAAGDGAKPATKKAAVNSDDDEFN